MMILVLELLFSFLNANGDCENKCEDKKFDKEYRLWIAKIDYAIEDDDDND